MSLLILADQVEIKCEPPGIASPHSTHGRVQPGALGRGCLSFSRLVQRELAHMDLGWADGVEMGDQQPDTLHRPEVGREG